MKRIAITTEFIRLDQLLKFAGLAMTGGGAKEAIAAGKVTVNGEGCAMRGKKLRPSDKVCFNGEQLEVVAGEAYPS